MQRHMIRGTRLASIYGFVGTALCASLFAIAPLEAQSGTSDPFAGSWRLNAAKSAAAWQAHPQPKRATPEPLTQGRLTIKVANGRMDYQVEHGSGGGQPKKATYGATFNDAKWQGVQGTADGPFTSVTLVKIHDRLHYWVTRDKDGGFAGLLLRKLTEDGMTLTAVAIGPDGYVQYVRVFDKQ